MTWNRKSDALVAVVDLQISKIGDSVTVNSGVFDPQIYKQCWGKDSPLFVDEPSCIVRARIGMLVREKSDLWWQISDQDTPVSLSAEVASVVLPFLEQMNSSEKMAQFLTDQRVTKSRYPLPIIYLAILRNALGDRASAQRLLLDLRKTTSGSWLDRIDEVMSQLGFA